MRAFVERARLIETLGRVVTHPGGVPQNILLENNDTIIIPAKTNVVQIGGEVFTPQAVTFQPGLSVSDYVAMAGGFTPRANRSAVVVLRANAEVFTDGAVKIRPGDQILILPKVDTKFVQIAADIVQVIYQIALAGAVVLGL